MQRWRRISRKTSGITFISRERGLCLPCIFDNGSPIVHGRRGSISARRSSSQFRSDMTGAQSPGEAVLHSLTNPVSNSGMPGGWWRTGCAISQRDQSQVLDKRALLSSGGGAKMNQIWNETVKLTFTWRGGSLTPWICSKTVCIDVTSIHSDCDVSPRCTSDDWSPSSTGRLYHAQAANKISCATLQAWIFTATRYSRQHAALIQKLSLTLALSSTTRKYFPECGLLLSNNVF